MFRDFVEELQELAKKHNLDLQEIKAKEGSMTTNLLLKFNTRTEAEAKEYFTKHASRFNAAPEWYGKYFDTTKGILQVVGINPRARKYPLFLKDLNGKLVKSSVGFIETAEEVEVK